jgi:hypothetical protein
MTDQLSEPQKKTAKEQLAKYGAELVRLKHALDLAFGGSGMKLVAPEEKVVLPLLISCRDIMEEILFAVRDGFGRAALRSTRTMYECAVTARYLHLYPEKTDAFLSMFHVQWAKIIQTIPNVAKTSEMANEIAANVPKYASGKTVNVSDLKWTDDYTLKMAKEVGAIANLHSLAFDYASGLIHPSALLLMSTLSQPVPGGNMFEVGTQSQDWEAISALRVAHDLQINVLDLRLKYAPSDKLNTAFDVCNQDFLKIWGYAPHI